MVVHGISIPVDDGWWLRMCCVVMISRVSNFLWGVWFTTNVGKSQPQRGNMCHFTTFYLRSLSTLPGWWFGTFFFMFPSYWECHHPNWRTPSFFGGVGQPATSNRQPCLECWDQYDLLHYGVWRFSAATWGVAERLGNPSCTDFGRQEMQKSTGLEWAFQQKKMRTVGEHPKSIQHVCFLQKPVMLNKRGDVVNPLSTSFNLLFQLHCSREENRCWLRL